MVQKKWENRIITFYKWLPFILIAGCGVAALLIDLSRGR